MTIPNNSNKFGWALAAVCIVGVAKVFKQNFTLIIFIGIPYYTIHYKRLLTIKIFTFPISFITSKCSK